MHDVAWTGKYFAKEIRREPDTDSLVDVVGGNFGLIASRVAASRIPHARIEAFFAGFDGLRRLDAPSSLPDIENASARIAAAIVCGEQIGIVTDHDVDGVTSHAVIYTALTRLGAKPSQISSYIGHRLKDGYGLSEPVKQRILSSSVVPSLVITADCGSSDEGRISGLKEASIDVVVTDHHEIPLDGIPASAFAVVSPARDDSQYPDKAIAGCMVSWLLMCATRKNMMDAGTLPQSFPHITDLLDYVALGTVADCVTMATSKNNRAVVRFGLSRISTGARPCWRASRAFLGDKPSLSAIDLAFGIGPRINARGRLDEAMAGVHFLLSETDDKASEYVQLLEAENEARKEIERSLTEQAVEAAESMVSDGRVGLAVWLEEGHSGVHGIVASRVVERFGAPTVCLSPHPVDPSIITGSVRGVEGIHVREILDSVAKIIPAGDMPKYGGHSGAGGLTIRAEALGRFRTAFDVACKAVLPQAPGPFLMCDGELSLGELDMDLLSELSRMEPFGKGFEEPVFEVKATVSNTRPVGQEKNHLSLQFAGGMRGIWFFHDPDTCPIPIEAGGSYTFYAAPSVNHFRGSTSVQLMIKGLKI